MRNRMRVCGLVIGMLCCFESIGQSDSLLRIEVAVQKTTSVVFGSAIVSIDRGSTSIIVQKSTENILKVKAAADSLVETNLTVVTAAGKLYSILVRYNSNPANLSVYVDHEATVPAKHVLAPVCEDVLKQKANLVGLTFTASKMSLRLLGWYVRGANMFCKLKIENRSQIGYDIDQLHFYIRDNSVVKRTALQEIILRSTHLEGDTITIAAHSSRVWIVALDKFTVPDDKHFAIEILERNGGRHLYLKSYNRQVMLAKEF
ncbi:conjugative transposon protein TraN [Sediminibacterium roseum]|uniref:Conjugative transposon protein TraN n=1 Tax=Sediminibacterium roseum TaxID=1978412 RepID=A0ABW9ZZ24_9BACT|nr:conjugative transposon protein TraN [Sediminibacterium roseum]NCI51298.1 conjugative transposon protein TraN [Sediminibacterium roseum]